jgi:hypothetical protein
MLVKDRGEAVSFHPRLHKLPSYSSDMAHTCHTVRIKLWYTFEAPLLRIKGSTYPACTLPVKGDHLFPLSLRRS